MKKVFIAFPGYNVQLKQKIKTVGDLEFWNLTKIDKSEFIDLIERRIKPLNKNIKRNNHAWLDEENQYKDQYDSSYKESSWGILLPDYAGKDNYGISSSLMTINLYSNTFLPSMFYVNKWGINITRQKVDNASHHQDIKFTKKKFQEFYKLLAPTLTRIDWEAYRVMNWDKEQWRLSIACLLFYKLEKHQNSKEVMTWQKECADLVTIFETLLSRHANDNGKYKIMQRIEALLGKKLK
ncbi:MAG: hypothetical protein ABID64_00525, partial [Nitrospirota bacterium]